jgi:signal transduction histidine kinase
LPSAKRSSTSASVRVALLSAAAALAVGTAILAAFSGLGGLAVAMVVTAVGAAAALSLYLIVGERRRHEAVEEELTTQASFLERLVESMGSIAATLDDVQVLERARQEAERLFEARASIRSAGDLEERRDGQVLQVPLRVRDRELAVLRLERGRRFEREDLVRATVLADFAARAADNARLFGEAEAREAERSRLSDQLITAEQDERRRLADQLHDGAVQSMSGIALMLDAALDSIAAGRAEDAVPVIRGALLQHRETIRSLRELSFNLEPVVLRDQGFTPAVRALAESVGLAERVQFEVAVEPAEQLAEKAQAALYQIIREAVTQSIRRGPPRRLSIRVERTGSGFETVIADDAPGERTPTSFDAIAERARTLNGRLSVEPGEGGGTTVRVLLPPVTAQG